MRAPRRFFEVAMAGLVIVAGFAVGACQDPCVALAERVCNCEPTLTDRRTCTIDRITNQQGRIETSDADKAFCSDKLDTCTCAALDENNLDACGFAADPAGAGDEGDG